MENSLVGQRISKARIKLGMSTQQLAERIGKSQATVSRIENGKQGVTLPLLARIAKVLHTHPFILLGEGGETGGPEVQRLTVFLQNILCQSRQRARLTIEEVEEATGISAARLEGFERGMLLPDENELHALVVLYPVDYEFVNQMYIAEQRCPLLVSKLSTMNLLLKECLNIVRSGSRDSGFAAHNLGNRIEHCLEDISNERQGGYFSLGHISDQLLAALQDEAFHARAEELARKWGETGVEDAQGAQKEEDAAPHASAAPQSGRSSRSYNSPNEN